MRVAIVGGGFGGLNAAKRLARRKDLDVTLLDSRNHHLFQPLLYQVATAGLSPAEIASPIRSILSDADNVRVILARIDSVDLKAKTLVSGENRWAFDKIVLACGSTQSYFGHPEWEEFAPGLKTVEQATEIRRRLLLAFELAEKETDPQKQRELLSFVIVGGGPTGVELAGAIAEISRNTLARDFRNIDPSRTRVILIEAGNRVLASFSEERSRQAARDLETLGVQIWTGTRVTEVNGTGVKLGAEVLHARTTVWAAGVGASPLNRRMETEFGVKLDGAGRVIVAEDLSIPGHPDVFVIGDQAHFEWNGHALPGLAPVAMQQGRHVARLLALDAEGRAREPFRYVDKGQMATIGRRRAVLEIGTWGFGGFFAWAAWLFVHIYYLIGFKNRIFVFFQWAWSYVTFQRGARLIVDKEWRSGLK